MTRRMSGRIHARFWWWLPVLGLPLLAIVWFATRPLSPTTVTLPDGRKLSLQAVTFGVQHRVVASPLFWQQVLGRWLPAAWAKRLGIQVLSHQSGRPALMVWISRRDIPASPPPINEASVVDDQGHEISPVYRKVEAFPGRHQAVIGWEFVNFPRRAREVRVRLYTGDNDGRARQAAEFVVRNPARRRYPVWQPSPPPHKQTRGELEFALLELYSPGPAGAKTNRNFVFEPLNTALFRVSKAGRVTADWRVHTLELADATGNDLLMQPAACSSVGEYVVADFRSVFWPSEPAWKLTAEFFRVADFHTNELILVPGLKVPAPGARVFMNAEYQVQGVALRVIQLQWEELRGIGYAWLPRWNAEVIAMLDSGAPGMHFDLTGVTDQRGRELHHDLNYQAPNGRKHFRLEIPAESTTLDLLFAVQRTQFVEFLVRPK